MWWKIDLRVRIFKSSLMVLNGSLHGEFYACSAGIGESILKTRNVDKTKINNHIKWLKLSQQKLFFDFSKSGVIYSNICVKEM